MDKLIMKNRVIVYISNGLLIIGAVIGVYILADIFIATRSLPAGVCPITNKRPLIILDIVILLTSLALSFFEKKSSADRRK